MPMRLWAQEIDLQGSIDDCVALPSDPFDVWLLLLLSPRSMQSSHALVA